jgi:hypothetical protein
VAEVRVQGDAEQTALRTRVDGQVQHDALNGAVDDPLDLPGGLLQDQEVIGAEEGHARRLVQPLDHRADGQVRIDDGGVDGKGAAFERFHLGAEARRLRADGADAGSEVADHDGSRMGNRRGTRPNLPSGDPD